MADSAPIFRSGVRNLLVRESEFAISEAANLEELESIVVNERPDLALID